MCLVFLTACGKDKKDDTVANVNTEETLTNTEVPTTENVIDTEEVVDTETETETETEHVPAVLNPDTVVYAEETVYTTTRVNVRVEPSTVQRFIRNYLREKNLPALQMMEAGARFHWMKELII